MSDIDNALVFSGFKTNQDLVQKAGVPLLLSKTNGAARCLGGCYRTAPIIYKSLNIVCHENVKRIKRLPTEQAIPCLWRDVKQYLRPNYVSRNVRVNILHYLFKLLIYNYLY